MIGFVTLAALMAAPAAVETYVELGGQTDGGTHGVLNAGLRSGPLRAELLTDTLELVFEPRHATGRAWTRVRLQGFAAEMLISPWTNGAPDPSSALVAMKAEFDAGWIENLGGGWYAGVQANARGYKFFARSDQTTRAVPEVTARLSPAAQLGWWSEALRFDVTARAHVGGAAVGLGVEGQASWTPSWKLAPYLFLRAGVGARLDELTRVRLGGLNPYVVPLAGAAWAEFWVEDYVAVRAGPRALVGPIDLLAFVDAARFDGQSGIGLGLSTTARFEVFFATLTAGYAPTIPRAEGVTRLSVWLLLGTPWLSL